jgi:putative transcriptional regulator
MRPAEQALAVRLGSAIRALRQSRGWSQAALAERLDVSIDYVSLLERGLRLPALPVLVMIADVFGADLDALVGRRPRPSGWMAQAVDLLHAVPADARPAVFAMLRGVARSGGDVRRGPRPSR